MKSPKIMVVEDERIVALHLRHQLERLGYIVQALVSSRDRVLTEVRLGWPDLILMDIDGDLDGIAAAALIPPEYHIPVIYLTAYSEKTTLERARATQPYGYLLKPFSERELHATIQMTLERCRVEAELRASQKRLYEVQKMAAIGTLSAGIARIFNDIFDGVIDNLRLLKEPGPDGVQRDRLREDALGRARRGADLTRRLLDFSRPQPLNPRLTDVNHVIVQTVKLLNPILGRDLEFVLQLAPNLVPVIADRSELGVAITNIMTNACDAMLPGGRLTIATRPVHLGPREPIRHSNGIVGDFVVIEASDTGSGMKPEVVARVLEPFFTTREAEGLNGLGLSTVFAFCKRAGGYIEIDSEPGHGTTVRLYLPVHREAGAPIHAAGNIQAVILVVDDDADLRSAVSKQLRRLDYVVIEADSGASGLATIAAGTRVDLLLTDIIMRGTFDGIELAHRVMQQRPDIKVLLMSGFAGARYSENIVNPHPYRLLNKPFGRGELSSAIRQLLGSGEETPVHQ